MVGTEARKSTSVLHPGSVSRSWRPSWRVWFLRKLEEAGGWGRGGEGREGERRETRKKGEGWGVGGGEWWGKGGGERGGDRGGGGEQVGWEPQMRTDREKGGAQGRQILQPPRSTSTVALGEPPSRRAEEQPGMQPPALPVPGPLALLDTTGERGPSIPEGSPRVPARRGAQVQPFPPPLAVGPWH